MRKCPSCFHDIPQHPQRWACTGTCPDESPASLTKAYGGIDVRVRPSFDVERSDCPRCGALASIESCPICRGTIPREWRAPGEVAVTCVAMVGARSTGKSVYLGVLKQQLEIFAERHGSVVHCLGDTESHYEERYGRAIFGQRQILPPTVEAAQDPDAQQPMIFQIRLEGREHILVLRDVAGEDLENLRARKQQMSFLGRADGIVFLLDPMRVESINEVLRGLIPVDGQQGGDGVAVLRQLLEVLEEFKPPHLGRSPVPLAVALSKFDALQRGGEVAGGELFPVFSRYGSPLNRDPSLRSIEYDESDGALLHAELTSLLGSLMGRELVNLLRETGAAHRFFAVSALGAPASGDAIAASGIAPFRILDPVKWLLSPRLAGGPQL